MAKVVVVYESRTGNTRQLGEALAASLSAAGHEVTLKKGREATAEDLSAADAVAMGGATYHHDLIPSMKEFLFKVESAELNGKPGLAFGSYGWSGQAIDIINDTLKNLFKMNTMDPLCAIKAGDDQDSLDKAKACGEQFAKMIG